MFDSRRSSTPITEHITVVGEAKLEFIPTVVEIFVSISRTEETATLAKSNVDARAARVISSAREAGIVAPDIRSSHLSISPDREDRDGEVRHLGFTADLWVTLKLREIKQFNQLIGKLVDVPVDRIVSIKTMLDDESAANQAVLAKAIEDAKGKAKAITQQFGVQLGSVFSVVALKDERYSYGSSGSQASETNATFEPGTIELEGTIEVTYLIAKSGAA